MWIFVLTRETAVGVFGESYEGEVKQGPVLHFPIAISYQEHEW
jgi:hypothetical protein